VPTIADVAARAGVSKATVSRVFSRPEAVRPETRDRVLATARELSFRPSRIARSLAIGRTGSIGLVVPDIANPYFGPVIKAVQREARRADLTVLTADSDEFDADEFAVSANLAQQADGLVLFSPRMPEESILELAGRLPVVVVNREIAGVSGVVISSDEGMEQAVEHLAALGHRQIAYVAGPSGSFSNQARAAAVRKATRKFDVSLSEFGPFEPFYRSGVRAGDPVIASGATAAITYNDLLALGLMQLLGERGKKVGTDISVVGFDDTWLAPMTQPPLTTVHAPASEAGTTALRWLIEALQGDGRPTARRARLTCELIVRTSTGPAPH
jgi:DNA-binding LacI/PurR family transcriptional regulator